ncbi:MAG: S8 family serine peptidase [bacterium]
MDPNDSNGHGTFIVGLLGSDHSNEISMLGVAPESTIIPLRIGYNLSVSRAKLVEGALLAADLGAKVINYSWASKLPNPLEEEMCRVLEEKGVLLVCSAGNEDSDFPFYPAAYDTALSVGSTDAFDARVEALTCYGPAVDIAAPGVFLKSTWKDSDTDYISPGFGNSYATAFVSGAAALLLSEDPTLTPAELRELLISTGAPTTGFGEHPTPRLDIAAAFDKLNQLAIEAPALTQLSQSGTLLLEPELHGEPEWISVSARGRELDRASGAPWQLEIDLTQLPDGSHSLLLQAGANGKLVSTELPIVVDNSGSGTYPLSEDFDSGLLSFSALELSSYDAELLARLRSDTGWLPAQLADNGAGGWQFDPAAGFTGSGAARTKGLGPAGYSAWDSDLLISRRIDLTEALAPGLRLRAHWNLEQGADQLRCLATPDNGESITLLRTVGNEPAEFSGYQPDWQELELDLTDYAGQSLQLLFLLQADAAGTGEEPAFPTGVWLDDCLLLEAGQPAGAQAGAPELTAWQALGPAAGASLLELSLPSISGADRVYYDLDCLPWHDNGPGDLHLQSLDVSAGCPVQLDISACGNRLALLRIRPYMGLVPGAERVIPLWLFNQAGDADGNGQVGQTDLDFIRSRAGQPALSPLYLPFADSDLDGLITEADAAAVGYFWTE